MDLILAFLAGSGLGAAAGGLVLYVVRRHLRAELGVAQEAEAARLAELAAARDNAQTWQERYQGEQVARAALDARVREQSQAHSEKLALLAQVRGEIEKDLRSIAADALRANQGSFVELANEILEKHKLGADADLAARQKAVETLVTPLRETLQGYKIEVEELERTRAHAFGMLTAEIRGVAEAQQAVRAETAKLVNALRAAPKTRGRWGEQTLRNVLELSGLSAYCDFASEESFARDGGTVRPDVIIRLPGERRIVVDAKTSLSAYLDAVEATDEAERERQLALHAAQLRAHMRALAGKSYRDLVPSPDFVVMFVPGDNFYAAAAERDPSLFEDAAAQGVVIVTPATLIALAKAVAYGWRQEKVAENAQRVHDLGCELYRRLGRMAEHISRCGDTLGRSVQHYNQLVGSLEHSVMPQARRFHELEVEGTATELALLAQIEVQPRALRPQPEAESIGDTAQTAAQTTARTTAKSTAKSTARDFARDFAKDIADAPRDKPEAA
ncbi:MAG: DNA recombination protein RmuC [Hyphomicrobiaceae bacterium]|nr:DNA recombination protein RmuC [Hyphomicrobiaceae bacterium]